MNILVIGSGGREHAIVDALSRNSSVRQIYAAPGNGGIADQAEIVPIPAAATDALLDFAVERRIDLTVVGPEVPLSMGLADVFRQKGLRVIGPGAAEARLESSKTHAKQFFKRHGIPTAAFQEFANADDAYRYLERAAAPIVVKADGLAAGKGVTVAASIEEARQAVRELMDNKTLGAAGDRIVIEEFLQGEEASYHIFADGTAYQPMVVSQDHKRRFDDDRGPNTGGMGAYSTDTILPNGVPEIVRKQIVEPILRGVRTYSGILYVGLMLTKDGPRVIECNARFGDPETQVILPRLKTDLLEVFMDIAEHRLATRNLEWSPEAAATVVLVSGGYPGQVDVGKRITGLEEARRLENVRIYHAGTRRQDGVYYTAGGRVLNVTAMGGTLADALERAYEAVELISFEGKGYRKDIGRKGLEKRT